MNKLLLYRSGDPTKPKVLLVEPTRVASSNINGNAMHSGLHIPWRSKLLQLNNASKAELRNKYSEVELTIIDEMSMVSSKSFNQLHKCLNEIFNPEKDVPFGGKSVLGCGDLCQLPPVRAKSVFTFNDTETMKGFIIMELWHKCRLRQLDQVIL